MATAVQHGRVESLSVWTWMSDCAAIGFLLSFCTGTEEIAGWEKVTWPNESSPCPPWNFSTPSLSFLTVVHPSAFLIQCSSAVFMLLYKVQIAQKAILVHLFVWAGKCLYFPLISLIFFVSWRVYPVFNPLPRIFRDIIEILDGEKEFFPKECFKTCREVDPALLLAEELHSYTICHRSPKRWHLHTIITIICKPEKLSRPGSGQLKLPGNFSTWKCLEKFIFRF